MVEMLPMLVVFIILFGLLLGFWSAIHRGILQNIAARHYAFEVLNNRTYYIYHRDKIQPNKILEDKDYYKNPGFRYFAIVDIDPALSNNPPHKTPIKEINLFDLGSGSRFIPEGQTNSSPAGQRQSNPIRLKQGYGICIDHDCGGLPP